MSDADRKTVLVIDDDEAAGKLAATHLSRAGFETLCAVDGEEGIQLARTRTPDAILLDLAMPGLDGFETCTRLKVEKGTQHIPIVILSSHHGRSEVLKALQHGADDFIAKPIDSEVLIHKIRSILPVRPATTENPHSTPTSEKREFVRLGEGSEASVSIPMTLVDLSEGGAALTCGLPIPTGTQLKLNSPLLKEILEMEDIPVRIGYSIQDGEGRPCRIGAEFVGLPESVRKRIRQYIFKKQAGRVRVK